MSAGDRPAGPDNPVALNRTAVLAMVAAVNSYDADGFAAAFAEDVVVEWPGRGERIVGRVAWREKFLDNRRRSQDVTNEIVNLVVDASTAALELVAAGTRDGERWTLREVYVYDMADGCITGSRCYM